MKNRLGVLAVCMLLVSCQKKGPEDFLQDYLNAMQQGNYSEYASGFTRTGINAGESDSITIHLMDVYKKYVDEKYQGLKSCEVVGETISDDGNNATVRVRLHFGNGMEEETEYEMIKSGDVWKINLDS